MMNASDSSSSGNDGESCDASSCLSISHDNSNIRSGNNNFMESHSQHNKHVHRGQYDQYGQYDEEQGNGHVDGQGTDEHSSSSIDEDGEASVASVESVESHSSCASFASHSSSLTSSSASLPSQKPSPPTSQSQMLSHPLSRSANVLGNPSLHLDADGRSYQHEQQHEHHHGHQHQYQHVRRSSYSNKCAGSVPGSVSGSVASTAASSGASSGRSSLSAASSHSRTRPRPSVGLSRLSSHRRFAETLPLQVGTSTAGGAHIKGNANINANVKSNGNGNAKNQQPQHSQQQTPLYKHFRRIPLSTIILFLMLLHTKYQESQMVFRAMEHCPCSRVQSHLSPMPSHANQTQIQEHQQNAHQQKKSRLERQENKDSMMPVNDPPQIERLRGSLVQHFLALERELRMAQRNNQTANTYMLSSPILRNANITDILTHQQRQQGNSNSNNNKDKTKITGTASRLQSIDPSMLTLDPYGFYVSRHLPNAYVANRQGVQGSPCSQAQQRVSAQNENPSDRNGSQDSQVTLLTHVSTDKLQRLQLQLKWWNGPASVAVYIRDIKDIDTLVNFLSKEYRTEHVSTTSSSNTGDKNGQGNDGGDTIAFHIYMEVTPHEEKENPGASSKTATTAQPSRGLNKKTPSQRKVLPYPHNQLRNLAMETLSDDTFFVAIDVDFVPSWDSHSEIQRLLSLPSHQQTSSNGIRHELVHNRRLFVLPAFSMQHKPSATQEASSQQAEDDDSSFPKTRQDLLVKVHRHEAEMFRKQKFPAGHAPTDFDKWLAWDVNTGTSSSSSSNNNNDNGWYPIEYAESFEPYVLGYYTHNKPSIPRYRTEFRGYGKNKLTWIMEMHRNGYSFGVLPTVWAVHMDHPVSNQDDRRNELDFNKFILYPQFLRYLDDTYGRYRAEQ